MRQTQAWVISLFILLLTSCSAIPISPGQPGSVLNPAGEAAKSIAWLTWLMLILGTLAFLLVLGLLFAALSRGRRAAADTPPVTADGDTGRLWPILGGIVLPLLLLGIVFVAAILTLGKIDNPPKAGLRIEVVGRRWWWEIKYPDTKVVTANEIHIPVGVPVVLQLQTADVIHSFWVPDLHGKMDLIPERINYLTLQTDKAGLYRGQCAEFCGLQHAHMGLIVIAQSADDFDAWLSAQAEDAAAPADPAAAAGEKVFFSAKCVFCHTVRGLEDKPVDRSSVELGPDLTHLASRVTIAGASLAQNRGNLAGWIVDAQHVKPGSLMPNIELDSAELRSLLAYLESLH